MTVAERARVHVLRMYRHDDELQATVSTVWGYRAECPCGWQGERRQVIGTARRDLRAHLDWFHAKR